MRSIEDILDFAIENETTSVEFYQKWAGAATIPATRKLLECLGRDEKFHREKLKQVAKQEAGPPWSCREEALGDGRYRVTFVTAPVCVRQTPLEGTCDEIATELERRLAR